MPAVVHVHVGACTGLTPSALVRLVTQLRELRYLQLSGLPRELGSAAGFAAAMQGSGGSRLRFVRGCMQPELEPACGFALLSYQGRLVDLESILHARAGRGQAAASVEG
jgi:hypothetical protein